MFVPGVVAFHPAAAEDPSYCAAWVTVCASKVALLVAVLFFFMNLATQTCKKPPFFPTTGGFS